MSTFDEANATPWAGTPGLYAIFNIDGQTALDEDRNGKPQVIHGWSANILPQQIQNTNTLNREFGDSFNISNVNQLWQLADIGDGKWLIINKKTGQYLAAKGNVSHHFEELFGRFE